MKYFNQKDTLYQICENYPETVDFFVENGFPQLADQSKRALFGKNISLEQALKAKGKDLDIFVGLLEEVIELHGENAGKKSEAEEKLKVMGLLPCPVRIPLQEEFNKLVENLDGKLEIEAELQAASMGIDWIEEHLGGENPDLPDVFLSAGFDLFFDKQKIGRLKEKKYFSNTTGITKFNSLFDDIELDDPAGDYSIISVVPAVFLVNTKELGDLPAPKTWEDLMSPEFERRVSLPVGDFDLFNGILLNIYKKYGAEGVKKLGRSMLESLHPAQMVKSEKSKQPPIVTIMPYFFTKMVKEGSTMQAVWPEDGAIISPIFMLTKKEAAEKAKPVIDFFASKEIGEILAHKGLFPSVHPDIDNRIPKENKFMWLGWEYINSHDISKLIKECEALFDAGTLEQK